MFFVPLFTSIFIIWTKTSNELSVFVSQFSFWLNGYEKGSIEIEEWIHSSIFKIKKCYRNGQPQNHNNTNHLVHNKYLNLKTYTTYDIKKGNMNNKRCCAATVQRISSQLHNQSSYFRVFLSLVAQSISVIYKGSISSST